MTQKEQTVMEMKQVITDFYYGKIHETKDAQGNTIEQKTVIPSLRRKLKKALVHDTVLPTADKWFRDIMTHLNSL